MLLLTRYAQVILNVTTNNNNMLNFFFPLSPQSCRDIDEEVSHVTEGERRRDWGGDTHNTFTHYTRDTHCNTE